MNNLKGVSKMDAQTRARYEKWKRNRIKRRIILPGIGMLFALIVLIVMIGLWGSEEDADDLSDAGSTIANGFELKTLPSEPIIYLFNAHPLEMIGSPLGNPYVGEMSIIEITHILASHFESHDIPTLVEEQCIDEKLYRNNWEFYMSYYAARYFVLDVIERYPSLEFFLDLHRDGIPHEYATAEIDGQSYARILFVIGTDNPLGYAASYAVARELHYMLEAQKPGISRGVFTSGGSGRDGVYSQDISPMLQLIELGTYTSTVEEVSRTVEILAEVLAEFLTLSNGDEG